MGVANKVFSFLIFFVFVLILILSTSTASVFVKSLFRGKTVISSFVLLITYLLAGSVVLSNFLKLKGVKSNIKQTFFVLLSIESGLILLFTVEHVLLEGIAATKLVTLFISIILFALSLLKSIK